MKLTNAIKDSIISAIMKDTPHRYTMNQRDKDALQVCVDAMPPEIKRIYDNKKTRVWVSCQYYAGFNYLPTGGQKLPRLEPILKKYLEAHNERENLRQHVRKIVNQFVTDKQMMELLPELEAYIPKHETLPKTNLPVVAGLMSELTKAGFPKDK